MKTLDELKKLRKRIAPNNWEFKVGQDEDYESIIDPIKDDIITENMAYYPTAPSTEEMKYIVEIHNLVPRLIKALEKCMKQRNVGIDNFSNDPDKVKTIFNDELEQILEGK